MQVGPGRLGKVPESPKYVWVISHYNTATLTTDVLAVTQSEEGKDKYLLRLMRTKKNNGVPINLNQVSSTLVQLMQ